MLLRVYGTFMRILLVRMSSMRKSLYLSVALCVSRFVCMSLLEYVLPCLYSTVCMTLPCVCLLRAYVPSMCKSPLCAFLAHILSCVCRPCVCPLHVYVPSMCMSHPCVCPTLCACPLRCMSFMCMSPPCVCPLCAHSVRMSSHVYVPPCGCPLRVL